MGIALNFAYLFTHTVDVGERTPDKRVLTLGVQDCYFDQSALMAFLDKHDIPHRKLERSEVEYTTGFGHLAEYDRKKLSRNLHQRSFFAAIGYSPSNVVSLDVSDFEVCDIVHDLNQPVPESLRGQFDLIIDAGTIEHVFSLKDAFFNLTHMCRVGGVVIHFAPVDYINHGFVNLNSYIFQDFYEQNGFERIYLKYIGIPTTGNDSDKHFLEIDPFLLREPLRANYYLAVFTAYRKIRDVALRVPMQTFYREIIEHHERLTGPEKAEAEVSQSPGISTEDIVSSCSVKSLGQSPRITRIQAALQYLLTSVRAFRQANEQAPQRGLPPHKRVEL